MGFSQSAKAIVRASADGDHVVAGMTVRSRVIKTLIAAGFDDILVVTGMQPLPKGHRVTANERQARVGYVSSGAADAPGGHPARALGGDLVAADHYIVHLSLVDAFLKSDAHVLTDSVGNAVFEKPGAAGARAYVHDPFYVFNVTQDSVSGAQNRLFKFLTKERDGFTSRYLNRPISNLFSRALAPTSLLPGHYTVFTAVIGILMAGAFMYAPTIGVLWGCLLFHLASIVDGVDGEIARLKFQQTQRGAKLDTAVDMATNIAFMVGVSYGLWHVFGERFFTLGGIAVGLAISGVTMMTMVLSYGPGGGSFDILAKTIERKVRGNPRSLRLFHMINYILKRDSFALIFLLISLAGYPQAILYCAILGLLVWNIAILVNAKDMIKLKPSAHSALPPQPRKG